jgi:hypothetical protein
MFAQLGVLLAGEGGFMPKYLFQGSCIGDAQALIFVDIYPPYRGSKYPR